MSISSDERLVAAVLSLGERMDRLIELLEDRRVVVVEVAGSPPVHLYDQDEVGLR